MQRSNASLGQQGRGSRSRAHSSQQGTTRAANVTELRALKEWGITLQALLEGRQQCLIRRGGVREKAFECPKDPFLLFPTGFHSDSSLCKPGAAQPYYNDLMWDPKNAVQIPVKGYAVVEEQFTTEYRDVFKRLDSLHIWTDEFLAKRLGKKEQPITALLLRVWQFEEPITVPQREDYWGCFSWVSLPGEPFVEAFKNATEVIPPRPWAEIEADFHAALSRSSR